MSGDEACPARNLRSEKFRDDDSSGVSTIMIPPEATSAASKLSELRRRPGPFRFFFFSFEFFGRLVIGEDTIMTGSLTQVQFMNEWENSGVRNV